MEILEYFSVENKEDWCAKIAESDWGAGQYLAGLLKNGEFKGLVGETSRVLLLVDGENLVSFCTLAEKDDIQPTELTPWVGWVYTFPKYRGQKCSGKLLDFAEQMAKKEGHSRIHISTNHVGLYEKFGYEFWQMMKDIEGENSRVYVKEL